MHVEGESSSCDREVYAPVAKDCATLGWRNGKEGIPPKAWACAAEKQSTSAQRPSEKYMDAPLPLHAHCLLKTSALVTFYVSSVLRCRIAIKFEKMDNFPESSVSGARPWLEKETKVSIHS